MDAFNWLHLSDLHWGQTGQKHLWPSVRKAFFDDLEKLHAKCGPWHAVLFTGDLVQKGEQFDAMEETVLKPLWERLRELGSDPVLLAVPGNHDLQRPDGKTYEAAVDMLLAQSGFQQIAKKFWHKPKCHYRKVIDKAFAQYRTWFGKRPFCKSVDIKNGLLPGDFSATIATDGGHRVGILGLNTTFLQLAEGDYRDRLAWDVCQFQEACDQDGVAWRDNHDVCFLMTHQPPDWLDEPSRKKMYPEINPAGRFVVHLFGHMHEEAIRDESLGGGERLRKWQAPSLFSLEHYRDQKREERRHGYCAGSLTFQDDIALLRHWPRKAKLDENGWDFIPDHEKCKLPENDATEPDEIKLQPKGTTASGAAASGTSFEQEMSRALESYHGRVQKDWDDRWSRVVGEGDDE